MIAVADRVEASIVDLVQQVERQDIPYAVMRNHEAFPHFEHDVDLVAPASSLGAIRRIATDIAVRHGWDALTECRHWAGSPCPHHNIESFVFYAYEGGCVQMDIFHAFLVLGLPFLDEDELLARTERDERGFVRLRRSTEDVLRMLQVHRLAGQASAGDKVRRYLSRIRESPDAQLDEHAVRTMAPFFARARSRLESDDMGGYRTQMALGRVAFALRFGTRHPLVTARSTFARAAERLRLSYTAQCGFAMEVCADTEEERTTVRSLLDDLVTANAVRGWTEHGRTRAVLEQGGIAVRWVPSTGRLTVDARRAGQAQLRRAITDLLIARHDVLWRRGAA